jgi:hypothetical protein
MGKDCVEIAGSASVLVDAYKHIKEFPSTATDSGTKEREAKHFCERVINTGIELEAVQAAALVLGIPSSRASNPIQYFSGWDVLRLARIASAGHVADIDFTHEEADDETRDHDDITHEEADNNGVAITHPVADDNDAYNEVAELQRAVPVQAALHSGCNGAIDLLQQFDENNDLKCHGYAQVYTTAQGEKLPVSAAHHYMHRDDRLWRFNAYEFGRLFNIRKRIRVRGTCMRVVLTSLASWIPFLVTRLATTIA